MSIWLLVGIPDQQLNATHIIFADYMARPANDTLRLMIPPNDLFNYADSLLE